MTFEIHSPALFAENLGKFSKCLITFFKRELSSLFVVNKMQQAICMLTAEFAN